MAEVLQDWFPPSFADAVLLNQPAPRHPVTNELMWEKGVRLHGQQRGLVVDPYRFKKADGGIRFGKSFAPAVAIFLDFMWRVQVRGIKDDLWGVVGDSYAMAQEEMRHLDRLLSNAKIPHDFHTPINQAWRISFPVIPAEMVTLTAADVTKIAARAFRGMVIAEAAQTTPDTYYQARLRVAQLRGWVMMSGTFENVKGPWYAQLTEEWSRPGAIGKVYVCPSWDNPLVYPGGRNDPDLLAEERTLPPLVFLEKFGGSPQKRSDVAMLYAEERYQVKRRFPYQGTSFDPERPVYLFIDPGVAHAYAVPVVQFETSEAYLAEQPKPAIGIQAPPDAGDVVYVIDMIYRWGRETEQIVEEAAARPWAANVQEAVMDFAGRQRRAEGPPVIEQWAKFWRRATGRHLYVHADPVPMQPGYDVHARALLNTWDEPAAQLAFNRDGRLRNVTNAAGPKLYFDPDAAAPLFGGYVDGQSYAGEYNEHRKHKNRQGTVTSDDYVDRDNDAIKAINYGLYWHFGPARTRHRMLAISHVPWEMTVA